MNDHPVQIAVADDLERTRVTVFFRLFMAIPHLIWLALWGIAAFFAAIANWFATLFTGRSPDGLHSFLAQYVRYATHVYAFLYLAANRFPGFMGDRAYAVDVAIAPPQPQNRWKTGFRLILGIPALALATALGGGGTRVQSRSTSTRNQGISLAGGALGAAGFLGWFASLARARMPRGLRDLEVYSLGYGAQFWSYMFLLTDRYPNSDPAALLPEREFPPHPVVLGGGDDLRRSRLTVFFRLLLAIPHLVWLTLWAIVAFVAAIVNWFATLFAGRSPAALHRFLSAFVRYQAHVYAFLYVIANPFPGFTGEPGSYPLDIAIAPPERQNRWITGFRVILAFPAFVIASVYSNVLFLAAIGGWFAGLFTARMPRGLRNVGAVALRYNAQLYSYLLLLTDRYPYSGPTDPAIAASPSAPPPPPAPDVASPLPRP